MTHLIHHYACSNEEWHKISHKHVDKLNHEKYKLQTFSVGTLEVLFIA